MRIRRWRVGEIVPGAIERVTRPVLWHVANSWMQRRVVNDNAADLPDRFDRTGVAFIHIPKNAGTSISSYLYSEQIGHWRWDQVRQMNPVKYKKWTKFAVTRNPVERFLSAYDFLVAGGINNGDEWFARDFVRPHGDINEFLRRLCEHDRFRESVMQYWHFQPQRSYVCSEHGMCMVDYLVPIEEIFGRMASLSGGRGSLPALNVTPGPRTQRDALNRHSLNVLAELYACDFCLHELAARESGSVLSAAVFS